MSDYLRTCRLCGKSAWADDMIKYGTRQYAHPECYVAKKRITDVELLPEHQRQKLYDWMDRDLCDWMDREL
jgi:adenosyl cobinamide kinase/adenosyl cobinamide phosphate guanylyltransferase